ncbi:hypothetical protein GCM10011507_16860 [Edaphobacter acidisoli]|uniref:Thioredoxin domain-containing protein n=2 Tax=Edaphobacter acidisoli TaxID=2040573 RepID=A0A916W4S9_9BACT|nr:thioredoxin domain-containing protein [Edaphobacter acidisoli]GGA65912.1 hypothetical protein GCM10011507_16860 [Edaphobacter acidisoli]
MMASLAVVLGVATVAGAQTQAGTGAAAKQATPPLQLQNLEPSTVPKDPFPPVNQKYFTATSPTVDTVNTFLKSLWGYDQNRIWRVEAIQKTQAPDVAKVIVFVSDKSANAKVQSTAFFVTPDGKHAIAGDTVIPFGATPFADARQTLEQHADGAWRGAPGKSLLLVEFADLECPHCKDAQGTMNQLAKDFPNAHIVFQPFPLTEIHPYAFKAAAYGYCVEKQNNDAFFSYADGVFNTQSGLAEGTADDTLNNAVKQAGLDPTAIGACANSQATKDQVNASIKLAQDLGVDQTPMLAVNGHLLPISAVPYETLKTIITYQAQQDGVSTGATAPTLGK